MNQRPSPNDNHMEPSQGSVPIHITDDTYKNIEGETLPSLERDHEARNEVHGESKKQLRKYSLAFSLTTFGVCQ
jgi:hypothetical protein